MQNLGRGFRPLIMLAAGSLFTLTVVGGVALAQNETIEACAKDNGELRIVETAGDCKTNETPLSWNVTGPVGPQGPEGPPGPPGPPTEFSLVRVSANGSFAQVRGDDVVSVEKAPNIHGLYTITFDHDVASCATNLAVDALLQGREQAPVQTPQVIRVEIFDWDAFGSGAVFRADRDFSLTVWC